MGENNEKQLWDDRERQRSLVATGPIIAEMK
jgi:hypothetical protein